MKSVNISKLPRHNIGANKGKINWQESIGYSVDFVYNDIIDKFIIVNYQSKNRSIIVLYNNKEYKITIGNLVKCKLGNIIGTKTKEYKANIGDSFGYNNSIKITSQFYKRLKNYSYKYYTYQCNICGADDLEIRESDLLNGISCSCCAGRTVVNGINDIPTTAPWMVKYFQGGYDEAKLYTKGSNKRIYPVCPHCKRVSNKTYAINSLRSNNYVPCICTDGISYPEKFICELLKQLGIDFVYQLTKTYFKWCDRYLFDFYINPFNVIIETHGLQHYKTINGWSKKSKTLEEEQANDQIKEQLAKENGIEHYLTLDCRKSDLEWIKNSVMESDLPVLLNFTESDIDWLKCEEFALNNTVKLACELWNNGLKNPLEISKRLKLHKETIIRYLNKGNKLKWCNYNKKYITDTKRGKKIDVYKNNKLVGSFETMTKLSELSESVYGLKFSITGISMCCSNKVNEYKGYTIKYSV